MIFRPGLQMRKCGKTLRRVESTELFTVSYGYYFDEPVWNWGCQLDICSEIILNDPRKIHRCSDKIVTAEMLADYFPKTWTEYSRDIPVPFIAKRNFTMMGRGKRIVRSHAERLPIRRRRELSVRR